MKANVIIPPFVRIDFPGKVLDKLSMNARSWLIKPNDASDIMAAKIHEMKKGKGPFFTAKLLHFLLSFALCTIYFAHGYGFEISRQFRKIVPLSAFGPCLRESTRT